MAETSGDRGFREGAVAVVPMAVAVFGFGLSYGVLARAAGMGGVAPVVMSITTFAGSAQFAAASVLQAGGAAATSALSALMSRRGSGAASGRVCSTPISRSTSRG
jgi:predicted branched-subunit amino acid permease